MNRLRKKIIATVLLGVAQYGIVALLIYDTQLLLSVKRRNELWEKGYVTYPTDPKIIELSKECMK